MDYSYLNQTNFDGLTGGTGVASNMDHAATMGYGDLAACGQMTHAAYRFGPSSASMAARSYNTAMGHHLSAAAVAAAAASGNGHNGSAAAAAAAASAAAVRGHHHGHHQDHHHSGRPTAMFSTAMNLPGKCEQLLAV